MQFKSGGGNKSGSVAGGEELSSHPPFQLGQWWVEPGTLTLTEGAESTRIERRLMDVLLCLVAASPHTVDKERLLSQVWGDQVIAEQGLTVAVYELRKALGDSARNPYFIRTIPKVGYRLLIKPAFARSVSPPPQSLRQPGQSLPLLLLIILFTASLGWFRWTAQEPTPPVSLAVLPLRDLSSSEAGRAFAHGFSDALINQLSRSQGLRVVSLTSVDNLLNRQKTISEISELLNVDQALEGTIQRRGSRILVTARLLNARNETSLHSISLEAHLRELSRLPAQVAQALAEPLGIETVSNLSQELFLPVDPDAYDLYLRGRFLWNRRDSASLRKAYSAFHEATQRQPDLAVAYAGMADCLTLSSGTLRPTIRETFTAAREFAEKALTLDPSLANAEASLAAYHFFFGWDVVSAEQHFRQALKKTPTIRSPCNGLLNSCPPEAATRKLSM